MQPETPITNDEVDEVFRLLQSDLGSLFKLVYSHRKPIAEGDIRLASVTLRKWLIGGLLGQFCKATGTKATFFALDNSVVLQTLAKEPTINYFITAGISLNGKPHMGIYASSIRYPGKPLLPIESMQQKEFTLGQFLKQKRLYFEGELFSCEELIKFTANKLGGAHLDRHRPGRFAMLEKAASFMMYGGPTIAEGSEPPSELYMVLEPTSSEFLSGLHLEIVAAASSFIQMRLNGNPVTKVEWQPTILSRLKRLLGQNRGRFRYGNFGDS